MGKRKTDDFIVSDEEDDESVKTASDESEDSGISAESAEVKPKSRKGKSKVATKDEDSDEAPSKKSKKSKAENPKSVKKPRIASESSESPSKDVIVQINSDNEKYVDLGKKKRATVRAFKGTPLIDIREFYGAEGDEKPGKKGISLTGEQWESLKKSSGAIDKLFAGLKK